MRDWEGKLENWVQVWDQLSESTRDCFPISRPSGNSWPAALPSCPTLIEFYARCDGGTFGTYTVGPLAEVSDPSSGEWSDSPGLELTPGRWIQFGYHEYGHTLLWDADNDEVVIYSPDDEEPSRLKRSMAQFLERLLYPSRATTEDEDDNSNEMWIEALQEAQDLA